MSVVPGRAPHVPLSLQLTPVGGQVVGVGVGGVHQSDRPPCQCGTSDLFIRGSASGGYGEGRAPDRLNIKRVPSSVQGVL